MSLNRIFAKPIDRPIEGVIKADDNKSLRQEVEEYVLTNEIQKRLDHFLSAYNDYQGANGVWLSGFFGSGKSHLLKMLALLLENREIDGRRVLEDFQLKCDDNEFLRAEMQKAAAVPSQSILFNIDQKADVISKTQIDALLSVFVKVFDEACGYYGKQGYIAQFERDLDQRDRLAPFREAFEKIAGLPWERGREQWLLEESNVAKAYAEVTGNDAAAATGLLRKYRDDYRVSIEDFAEMVKRHIDRQGPDFRLNFFVDEVGQYIAGNIKLMLNLQTIAESLASRCNGRSWIIVTAQEDMDSVIGGMSKSAGDDFTKIQARFAIRLKLTSTNVAEVIQRRLLQKTEAAVPTLKSLYEAQAGNLKTVLGFTDGSTSYKNYRDVDHFVDAYPFVPYQFDLFQSVIQSLSVHNVFEGKHSSVGERSMLAVFQQVAKHIQNQSMGQLATFDLMFEGMRAAIKAKAIWPILSLEKNAPNDFAPRLLKALFLVKYVQGFKATVHNLSILMLESFDEDQRALNTRVQETLNWLEQQTYIQRSGELYEYLTDEEKDVEQEIKNTDVDTADLLKKLDELCFDQVLNQRKIRYDENGQDYAYSRKLDDKLFNREQELAIHIFSPLHDDAGHMDRLRGYSVYNESELVVILPADDRLVRDLGMLLKTEKYFRQQISNTQKEEVRRILTEKNALNQRRQVELQERVRRLLGSATLLVGGNEHETSSEDGRTRVIQGFQVLIQRNYPSLRMLRNHVYTEEQIGDNLKYDGGPIDDRLPEPEQEILSFIHTNQRTGVRTTIKSTLERFERKPYGWYQAAILCNLARLVARGKVDLRADGNLIEQGELERALRNSHGYANVWLEPQVEFTAGQVRALKDFYAEFFNDIAPASEAKPLGQATLKAFQDLHEDLAVLAGQSHEFPFLQSLEPALARLKELRDRPYDWYLRELPSFEDELLDLKEELIDPIRNFMSGPQKDLYREARDFLSAQSANIAELRNTPGEVSETRSDEPAPNPTALADLLNDPTCYKGNRLSSVRGQLEAIRERIEQQRQAAAQDALAKLEQLRQRLQGLPECGKLSAEQQRQIVTAFESVETEISNEPVIPLIRDRINRFEQHEYGQWLNRVVQWAKPAPPPDAPVQPGTQPPPVPQFVHIRSVPLHYPSPWLADEQGVDSYLQALREVLLEELRQGKHIQV
jgi:hypothetical protein